MDPATHYPEPLGEAFGQGAQRAAQLAAIVTAAAQVYAQHRAHHARQRAGREERAARAAREQARAAGQQARMRWAPAHDPRWLAQAGPVQTAAVWGAAAPYADADPVAASALRRCEDRLRSLHPYAMARYDRLRSDGMSPVEAMREAAPLFARAPHARTGEPGAARPALDGFGGDRDAGVVAGAGEGPPGGESGAGEPVHLGGEDIPDRSHAHAGADRRLRLGPDELVIAGEMTDRPGDGSAKLAGADSEERAAPAAERAGRGDLGAAAGVPAALDLDERAAGGLLAAGRESAISDAAAALAAGDRRTAQLTAESFPFTAAEVIAAVRAGRVQGWPLSSRPQPGAQPNRRAGRSV